MAFLNQVRYHYNQTKMWAKLIGIPFNIDELEAIKAMKGPCEWCNLKAAQSGLMALKRPKDGYVLENIKKVCKSCYSKL